MFKVKGITLQTLTGPEGSRRLRLPDFKTIGTLLTGDARNLLDRWSPLLAKEGVKSGEKRSDTNLAEESRLTRYSFGIFYMPHICDTGPTALLPFRRKACCGFLRPKKIRRLRPGSNPRH
jgi:hypothetical protein